MNGISSTLLRSYLSNRKQYVTIGEVTSAVLSITTGVPQGSIIGPLLFNIYINDIIKSSAKFSFILYADDTTLNSTLKSFGDTAVEIQLSILNELQKVCKWLDLKQLCLNVAKSKFMLFHMPQKVIPNLHAIYMQFYLNGAVKEYVHAFNFLGLTIDSNLSFKSHISIIGSKISRVIGLLSKLKYNYIPIILTTYDI